jgi:membrane protein YqaA with SNARE-associated domain
VRQFAVKEKRRGYERHLRQESIFLVVIRLLLCWSACAMHNDAPLPSDDLAQARATRNPLRKLYYWTLHWAATPYALPALVLLSFAESSFFPVPPDVLLIALCFCQPGRWFRLAAWCTAASVAGGVLGYGIGWGLWETVGQPIVRMYHGEAVVETVRVWYETYGFFGVLIAAVTPIPYKVFTIASGLMRFDFTQFVLASVLGRGFRFFLVAGLIRLFGRRIKPFMEQHFELAASLLVVLAILGFVAIKYLK